jgi:hypothetical protein
LLFSKATGLAVKTDRISVPRIGGANSPAQILGKGLTGGGSGGIISQRGGIINKPIEGAHPAEIAFNAKELSGRQQRLLDMLPDYDSRIVVNKRDVSMLDLSALTAKTGDEFAMFTKAGERLIVRGNYKNVPLKPENIEKLRSEGYRWSGHTHPGIAEADLIASDGDKNALELFRQRNSVIYNAAGRHKLIKE